MFIVGGFNAYPAEIENIMMGHHDVASVAIVGVPDPRLGEVGMAFVVPTTGVDVDTDALIAWCRENMANYKVPRYVELVDEPAAQRVEQGAQVRAGGAGEAAAWSADPTPVIVPKASIRRRSTLPDPRRGGHARRGRMTGTAKGTPRARHETRGKTGRPAKLDREMIAHAAYEIGLDRVTMKAVADQLGVSVPGLYHHVEGRDDLMQLAAQYSASRIHLPEDRNQSWPEWLLEWSRVSYLAFLSQPELLIQSMRGSFTVDRMVIHVDAVVGFLIDHGFSPVEARDAYTIVSRCAIGAAISEIRQNETGRGLLADYHRVLSSRTPEELPNLRKVVSEMHDDGPTLEQQICTVLIGIAACRGEPWKPILELATPSATNAEFDGVHP